MTSSSSCPSDQFYTIDIGCNFADKKRYSDKNLESILSSANECGVAAVVSISNSSREWNRNIELSTKHRNFLFTLGCHPHNAKDGLKSLSSLENLVEKSEKCAAVGECGLDYDRMFSSKEQQIEMFECQIMIAKKLDLPLYIHCRDAFEDTLALLKKHGHYRGVIHCFSGDLT
jgi:TatD DNase family protein